MANKGVVLRAALGWNSEEGQPVWTREASVDIRGQGQPPWRETVWDPS